LFIEGNVKSYCATVLFVHTWH